MNDSYIQPKSLKFTIAGSLREEFCALSRSTKVVKLFNDLLLDFSHTYKLQDPYYEDPYSPNVSSKSFSEVDSQLRKDLFNYSLCYNKFGEKYNHLLSYYRSLLDLNFKICMDKLVSRLNAQWTENQLLNYLKDFGTYLLEKVVNSNYPKWLLQFVEIHMLSGYDSYAHRKFDMYKDIVPFTVTRKLEGKKLKLFKKHIRETIDKISINQFPNLNFDDYVRYRDNWNLMGSATLGLPMRVHTQGFRKPTRIGSKFTNLLYYSDDQLLKQLRKYEGHIIRPFLKTDEPFKARIVIGYDTRSYIRCDYLSAFLRNFNGSEIWTTVGMKPQNLFSVREQINQHIQNQDLLMVCTDQSAFDQHVYKDLFVYAFNYLCSKILRLNPQVREIVNLENYGMQHAKIYLPNGDTRQWVNGLLSGHKFTALLGSVLNRASTMTALELAKIVIRGGYFQGDDALIFLPKDAPYESFINKYNELGLVVNPMKTWHNTNCTEYLHQVYFSDQVVSLPARSALGGFFKDPKAIETIPDSIFNNDLDLLRMMSRRGLNIGNAATRLTLKFVTRYSPETNHANVNSPLAEKRKLRRKNKQNRYYLVYNYLHTPTLYGGGGFEPYVKPRYYTCLHVSKDTKGLQSEIISPYHYKIFGMPNLTKRWILKKIYDHLPMPNVDTRVRFFHVPMTMRKKINAPVVEKKYYNFNPHLSDNSSNWCNHVLELLSEQSPYGPKYASRYSRARSSIDESFNLISNVTNAFLSGVEHTMFKLYCSECFDAYVLKKNSLNEVVNYLMYKKTLIYYNYRDKPPIWYDYGFFF